MKVISSLFKEISRPISYLSNFLKERFSMYKEVKNNFNKVNKVSELDSSKPPVPKNVSKSEFKKRIKGLRIHCYIILVFLIYSILYFTTIDTYLQALVVISISLMFSIMYMLSIYRLWLGKKYLKGWDTRNIRIPNTVRQFCDELLNNPKILIPTT